MIIDNGLPRKLSLILNQLYINNTNLIYYVTEPCYNEKSKPSGPVSIKIIFDLFYEFIIIYDK